MKQSWAVVKTKLQEEKSTSLRVARQGFIVYVPVYRARRNVQGVRKILPLFDRSFFVLIQRNKPLAPIVSTRGVHGMIQVGECLGKVKDEDIQYIRSQENSLGYVVIKNEEPPAFDLRQSVSWRRKEKDGTEIKLDGIYLGGTSAQRANVLFAMMGCEIPIEVQKQDLAAA